MNELQLAHFEQLRLAVRKVDAPHMDQESVETFPVTIKDGRMDLAIIDNPEAFYRV